MGGIFYLMLFLCIGAIWLAIKKVRAQSKHLFESDFRDLMKNNLRGDNYHRVVQHLGICEECRKALEEFNKKN